MLIQVLSDIHLEMSARKGHFTFPQAAPYLFLAGDIGDPSDPHYETFLLEQAARFDKVFVIAGNHEHYGKTLEECHDCIARVCSKVPDRLIYLDCDYYDLDEYCVLGATLWSHVTPQQTRDVQCFIADHRCIKEWGVQQNNQKHAEERDWLLHQIRMTEREGRKAIVLTHHAPSIRGTSAPQHENSMLSSAFCTDLRHLLAPPVVLWAFGHTHYCSDQYVNGVRLVSNQSGYPGEATGLFNPAKVLQL